MARELAQRVAEDARRADADAAMRRARAALDALVAEISSRRAAADDALAAAVAAEVRLRSEPRIIITPRR